MTSTELDAKLDAIAARQCAEHAVGLAKFRVDLRSRQYADARLQAEKAGEILFAAEDELRAALAQLEAMRTAEASLTTGGGDR